LAAVLGVVGLAGCTTAVPESNAGVGFTDYAAYELERANREAALQGSVPVAGNPLVFAPVAAAPIGAPVPGAVPPGGISTTDLAAAGIGGAPVAAPVPGAVPGQFVTPTLTPSAPLDAAGLDAMRAGGVQASPGNAAPVVIASSGISDEQDFDAVASRESIESDAQRRAAQAAAYTVIQPTALPDQPQDTGPNIVDYALNAPNRKGQAWYSRFVLSGQGRFERNCSEYRSPDEAQRDFLSRGGPDRDPRGIDPDGDGFACGWDPAPFLAAVGR
jgi:hypothetical protein